MHTVNNLPLNKVDSILVAFDFEESHNERNLGQRLKSLLATSLSSVEKFFWFAVAGTKKISEHQN